jgi:membrane-bound lytic murein transglycosylase B
MRQSVFHPLAAALLGLGAASAEEVPDFDAFRTAFKIDAVAAGIDPALYDREMATAVPRPVVLERQDDQPEFVRPLWDYVEGATSAARVKGGTEGLAEEAALLAAIEAEYGVPAEVIVAIWGMESSYGRIMGDHDVLSALATLAYDGRRQAFGRTQLIAALSILQEGYAPRETLVGSWAGAMGQTQFIPTTYLEHAVDHDGDGDRDLWADRGDVFASTANYLSRSGWKKDLPWGFEVVLPDGFDYAEADIGTKRSVGDWLTSGVATPGAPITDHLDLNAQASLILPAGAGGPAFLVTDNFRAILRYNNSTAYALGVAMLSEAVAGSPVTLTRDWPRGDRPLTLDERKALQEALATAGYDPGPVDGIIGAGTRKALRRWQSANGLPADGYASPSVLAALLGA